MARMNWAADRRRRLRAQSVRDEIEQIDRDPAARWLARFLDPDGPIPRRALMVPRKNHPTRHQRRKGW
ncbi:MAG: hypothetical protein GEU95_10575 [Rhizobiales bacterium]|nr:hypothetical protein [Hyphomicrobiales bacterium]